MIHDLSGDHQMTARLLVGAVAASLAMFVWGFLFWGVLPWSKSVMRPLPEEAAVIESLKAAPMPTAVYFYPFPAESAGEEAMKKMDEQHRAGPIVEIRYRAEGAPMMDPATMAKGYLHFLAATFLAGLLLCFTLPAAPGFVRRWGFVFLFGVAAAFFHDFSGPIWFFNPWDFAVLNFGYHVVGWLIGGFILAMILRPTHPQTKVA
jgi:hypothetical protein